MEPGEHLTPPPVMVKPSLLAPGDRWTHRCPHGCATRTDIQGGKEGFWAHMETVHPGEKHPALRKPRT